MSKGARFQLYLALRVVGYFEFVDQHGPVPFVADDILETFDDFRAEEAFRLFTEMAGVEQVIYLSHYLQEFSLSGGELVAGEAGRRQGRASPGRAVPAGRIHRDEHELAKPLGGTLLQQARHRRTVDQGRQTGHALDKAVVPSVPGEPGTAAAERAGLQPGQLVAAARTA